MSKKVDRCISILELDESENSQSKSLTDFQTVLRANIKVNRKNRRHRQNPESSEQNDSVKTEPEVPENPARVKLNQIKENLPKSPKDLDNSDSVQKISAVDWFVLNKSAIKNMVQEIDYIELSKSKKLQFKDIKNKHQELFKIGKLLCHDSSFTSATNLFSKAKNLASKLNEYKVWKSMSMIKALDDFKKYKESSGSCCGRERSITKRDYLMKIINKLAILPNSIETLWCLMEISLLGILVVGEEVEPARFYATMIKKTDEFFGMLAWCQIFLKEHNADAQGLLMNLITTYPKRPEPYYMAWKYYFRVKKYDRSLEVAVQAFLKITENENYYIVFCLCLAKSYYYCGEFSNCIELLQKKYIEHPNYPIFLFSLAKYCVLSEDFSYSGMAKGNLKELLRISDDSRKKNIFYYLANSYWLTRQFPESYKYALKSVQYFGTAKSKKKSEIEKKLHELNPMISNISILKEKIRKRKISKEDENLCQEVRNFHRPIAELLLADILYLGSRQDEAVSLLKSMISTSRLETSAYFKLLRFDPLNSETIFKGLLTRSKNSQIPTQVWVKANLLYSKFMFKSFHYNKAFYVLRTLAKMMPPLPYLKIPYCVTLQLSENLQDLSADFNVLDTQEVDSRYSFFDVKEVVYLDRDHAPHPKVFTKIASKKNDKKVERVYGSLASDRVLCQALDEYASDGENIQNFSVCSSSKFLYYIARFSLKLGRNKEEGLFAIKDFKELLSIEKNEIKRNVLKKKADSVEMGLSLL